VSDHGFIRLYRLDAEPSADGEPILFVAATAGLKGDRLDLGSGIPWDVSRGIEDGAIRSPRIEHAHGEHRFASVDDVFGSGHLPDSVCAMARAWMGAAPKAVMTGRLSA